ncbi:hypothetical protein [Streptomyces sp. ITFR-16]|uniref:hypothetical protein n=1 Tax=Streptomyces sp. ITFR-16 TaxID=3075198 RepID=UPI00288BF7E4|nr:hypothetical protein [Streptomyces sp. ITFR-16]WNI27294.1 hypothetical protein RLT58_35750 [Streptomyces sp. ITFR-16]
MSEQDDATAAQASLRKAVEQLSGDGSGDDVQAAQEAVQALHERAGQEWTPEQETQIRAMVEQIRKLRNLNRPGGGGWRRRRAWRAQGRLADLMMAAGPELVNEAELRHWKNHLMVELLVEFAGGAMKPDDTATALSRMETLHAATYEQLQQARKRAADRHADTG